MASHTSLLPRNRERDAFSTKTTFGLTNAIREAVSGFWCGEVATQCSSAGNETSRRMFNLVSQRTDGIVSPFGHSEFHLALPLVGQYAARC